MENYIGYAWIKVPRYKMSPKKDWEARYKELEEHHVMETTFLINEVRKLAAELERSSGVTYQPEDVPSECCYG